MYEKETLRNKYNWHIKKDILKLCMWKRDSKK